MARSSSGSDDEAPEALTFNSTKKRARQAEDDLRAFQSEEKRKKKEKNRVRDKNLKERAALSVTKSKGKGKQTQKDEDEDESDDAEGDDGRPKDDLEARMERAMREAQEESESDFEGEEGEEVFPLDQGTESGEGSSLGDESEDEDEGVDKISKTKTTQVSKVEKTTPKRIPKTPNYLPDHLFASAFADSPKSTSKRKRVNEDELPPKSKKRRTKKSSKDIVVGSVPFSSLPPNHSLIFHTQISHHSNVSIHARTKRTTPNTLCRVATTKDGQQVPQTDVKPQWKRYSCQKSWMGTSTRSVCRSFNILYANVDIDFTAHIGVLKRSGPAANFVRGS